MALAAALFSVSTYVATAFWLLVVLYSPSSPAGVSISECVFTAVPVSIVLSSWAVLLLHTLSPSGLQVWQLYAVSAAAFVAVGFAQRRVRARFIKSSAATIAEELRRFAGFWVLFAVAAVLLGQLARTHYLLLAANGSLRSAGSTWGDLPFHLNIISSFVYGPNRALGFGSFVSSIFAGSKLVYPFICNYHSALLILGGMSFGAALAVPATALLLSFVALLFFFGARFTGSRLAGAFAVLLSVFSGGLGFYHDSFFGNWAKSGVSLSTFLLTGEGWSINYVHFQKSGEQFWFQTLTDTLLPQRAALLAYPLCLSAMSLLYVASAKGGKPGAAGEEPEDGRAGQRLPSTNRTPLPEAAAKASAFAVDARRPMLVAGFLIGLTPFCQGHAFVSMGIFAPFFALFSAPLRGLPHSLWPFVRKWLHYAVPMIALGVPQLVILSEKAKDWGIIQFKTMWHDKGGKLGDAVHLWYMSLGLFVPLAALAAVRLDGRQLRLYAAAWVVFVASNFLLFQPWKYDNLKVIQLWHFVASAAVGGLLSWLYRLGANGKLHFRVLVVILLAFLVFSGGACVAKELAMDWELFTTSDVAVAEFVKTALPPNATFVSSDKHNNPIPCLTGRPVVLGYRGWLSSHGYDYREREQVVKRILSGSGDTLRLAKELGATHVAIGDAERNSWGAKEDFFKQHFATSYRVGPWAIYDLQRPLGGGKP
eukprot:tig00021178_g19191.t1